MYGTTARTMLEVNYFYGNIFPLWKNEHQNSPTFPVPWHPIDNRTVLVIMSPHYLPHAPYPLATAGRFGCYAVERP